MRRTVLLAIGVAVLASIGPGLRPALAQYGAIAYDVSNGRWGATWNHRTPADAQADALRDCNSASCEIRLSTGPRQCGALATTENRLGWGTALRPSRDAAQLGAMENCQKYNSGQCFVRVWDCNG
jgi:hypothetical protein